MLSMAKLTSLDANGSWVNHDYGNIYFCQPCGDSERLVIGPTDSQIELLDNLAAMYSSRRYYLLYVLLVSHARRDLGRYQSPLIDTHENLQLFLRAFQEFFEGDGRHHMWVASPDSDDLLIYDQHNVIFAYGNLGRFESVLNDRGYRNKEFWFPSPHSHWYPPVNVNTEDELMAYFDWQYFDLQPGDEWD